MISGITARGKAIVIYEPIMEEDEFDGLRMMDGVVVKNQGDVMVVNHPSDNFKDLVEKVYTNYL